MDESPVERFTEREKRLLRLTCPYALAALRLPKKIVALVITSFR